MHLILCGVELCINKEMILSWKLDLVDMIAIWVTMLVT